MMWVVSDRKLIRQFLEHVFQLIFVRAVRIRHGGSEESVDAVRRQFLEWVKDRFTESADVVPIKLPSSETLHNAQWRRLALHKSARRR